jgi:hypothetical protein
MSRGRYFQYLNSDDLPIPKTTIWNKRKRKNEDVDHENNVLEVSTPDNNLEDNNNDDDQNNQEIDSNNSQISETLRNLLCEAEEFAEKNRNFNQTDLCAALLALFFSSKITQSAFSVVLNFTTIVTDLEIPKDFDSCANMFLKSLNIKKIDYSKKWFCDNCNKVTIPVHQKQRMCQICFNK